MRVRQVVRGLSRSADGQGLVEFAIVIPLFLIIACTLLEGGRYMYTRLTIRHITAEATRFAVTGNMLKNQEGKRMCRAASVRTMVQQQAGVFKVRVDSVTLNPADGGGPGDIVRIRTNSSFNFVVPGAEMLFGGNARMTASSAMRNEPFPVVGHEVCT